MDSQKEKLDLYKTKLGKQFKEYRETKSPKAQKIESP